VKAANDITADYTTRQLRQKYIA